MTPLDPSEWRGFAAANPSSVLLVSTRHDCDNHRSFLFAEPMRILSAQSLEEIPAVFQAVEDALANGNHVAGFLSYEAGYHFEPTASRQSASSPLSDLTPDLPLVWFGVYETPSITSAPFTSTTRNSASSPDPLTPNPAVSSDQYMRTVHAIREYICAGDIYQANFTIPIHFDWPKGADLLYQRVMANQPVPYGALINLGDTHIVSASPELFFQKRGRDILTRPMKGTAARGRDVHEDAAQIVWLSSDPKNRAENVMIVDLLRNDLGRICEPGSVQVNELFSVEKYRTVLQMISSVRGNLLPQTTCYDLFRSLFPCGSITGAPKIRAMQIIRQLEQAPRGIACGAIGYFAPDGNATFSVAIRTLTLRNQIATLRVGSGITFDSHPQAEFSECQLKARFLTHDPEPFELIETILWNGEYFLLDLHLSRLAESALYFDFRHDGAHTLNHLLEFAATFPPSIPQRIQLTLSQSGQVRITAQPLAPSPSPVTLALASERTQSSDPFLRHKTTRRALYDRVLGEARASGADDVIFLNERNEVTECSIHNLLIERNGEGLTPALDCGVLPGVYRTHLLRARPHLREAVLHLEDLLSADRLYIFNSVRGMRPVESMRDLRTWASSAVPESS